MHTFRLDVTVERGDCVHCRGKLKLSAVPPLYSDSVVSLSAEGKQSQTLFIYNNTTALISEISDCTDTEIKNIYNTVCNSLELLLFLNISLKK